MAASASFKPIQTKPSFAKTTEPCRRFAKGICKLANKCRYLHVDAPGRPTQAPPPKRKNTGTQKAKAKIFSGQCFSCGVHGHRKADCPSSKKGRDSSHVIQEQVMDWPIDRTEDQAWVAHSNFPSQQDCSSGSRRPGVTNAAGLTQTEQGTKQPIVWLVDGGTTCHVLCSFHKHETYIYNRRGVDIDIVGVGGQVKCRDIGDMCIRVVTNGITKVLKLLNVRLCPNPGINLLSGPRMEAAGWGLSYKNRVFTAVDKEDRFLMTVRANEKGLYFFNGEPCLPHCGPLKGG